VRLEPNGGKRGVAVCVMCVFLQSIGLPVFPTGAIVVACKERESVISLDPGLPLGWEGITDPVSRSIHYESVSVRCILSPDVLLVCMARCTNLHYSSYDSDVEAHARYTVLCVFSQSIGLPVFPTGAIVVVGTEKENMISPDPGLPPGWRGGALPTLASQSVFSLFAHSCPIGSGWPRWMRLGSTSKVS
jgi:hypothetical protein